MTKPESAACSVAVRLPAFIYATFPATRRIARRTGARG